MSGERRVAPGGKATLEQVAYVRRYGVEASIRRGLPLSRRQLLRIANREAWSDGWAPARLPDDESRQCAVCGAVFGRRFDNGRPRSDALWRRKLTCGPACSLRLAWSKGSYADRRAGKDKRPTRH